MRDTYIVAAREIRQRVSLFYLAAASAVLPLLTYLMPRSSGMRSNTLVVAAGTVSATLAIGIALILGGTMITSEVIGRRMSFYLSRPLAAPAVWFGKLIAAFILTVGAFLISGLPSYLIDPHAFQVEIGSLSSLVAGTAVLWLVLILFAHAGATAVRSRSAIIGLDVLMLVGCGAVCWLVGAVLLTAFAVEAAMLFLKIFLIVTIAALVAAGAWQVSRGRVDARRNHVELSKFLWSVMGIFTVLFAALAWWFISVTPRDLSRDIAMKQAPQGPWALFSGQYRHRLDYHTSIVYNTETGRYVRLAAVPYQGSFSHDGRWLLSVGVSSRGVASPMRAELVGGSFELMVTDLSGEPNTSGSGINVARYGDRYVISDDGRFVAISGGSNVVVHELATKRLVNSVRLPFIVELMFFDGPNSLRVISPNGDRPIRIGELDLARRAVTMTGAIMVNDKHARIVANGDGSRLLLEHWTGSIATRSVQLLDGRSGAVLADLGSVGRGFGALFLSDGRIAVAGSQQDRGLMRIFTPSGGRLADFDLGLGVWPMYPTEVGGCVAILRRLAPGQRKVHAVVTVDLASGTVKTSEGFGLVWGNWATDPRSAPSAANRRLLVGGGRGLMAWDPATGATRSITQ